FSAGSQSDFTTPTAPLAWVTERSSRSLWISRLRTPRFLLAMSTPSSGCSGGGGPLPLVLTTAGADTLAALTIPSGGDVRVELIIRVPLRTVSLLGVGHRVRVTGPSFHTFSTFPTSSVRSNVCIRFRVFMTVRAVRSCSIGGGRRISPQNINPLSHRL